MSATISSINYCPVKSVSFQTIDKCEIKKDIGIIGDRIFAFAKDLDLEQVKLFEKNPEERRGKWNKILTLKNSPALNKYNFLFNENKEETSGVKIKSVFCFIALIINFFVFFKYFYLTTLLHFQMLKSKEILRLFCSLDSRASSMEKLIFLGVASLLYVFR